MLSSSSSNSVRTSNTNSKITEVPVGQLVDIPLEGAGESLYEVSPMIVIINIFKILMI